MPHVHPPRSADPSSALIFGVNFGDTYEHLPAYIDKILKGAKAGSAGISATIQVPPAGSQI